MSSVSGVGGNYGMMMQGMSGIKRPDPTQMADELFKKIDSSGQGYIQKSDLQKAFDSISAPSSTTNVDDMFSKLDGDGDGKVTKQEFSDTIKKLADQLNNQFINMRMNGGIPSGGFGGMAGIPSSSGDEGLSKDQIGSLLKNMESSNSKASDQIKDLSKNFEKADTNGDGKVNFEEAMAYQQSANSTSSSTSVSSNDLSSQLLAQIEKLSQYYGISSDQSGIDSLLSSISTSA